MGDSSVKEKIVSFLRNGGIVRTRLLETSMGDVDFLQWGSWNIPPGIDASESDFIAALRTLEQEGLVRACETVAKYDSSEYLLLWSL
jgi:hypothetical protein